MLCSMPHRLIGGQLVVWVDSGSVLIFEKGYSTNCDIGCTLLSAIHEVSLGRGQPQQSLWGSGYGRCPPHPCSWTRHMFYKGSKTGASLSRSFLSQDLADADKWVLE